MLEIIRADGTSEKNKIAAMRARAAEVSADVDRAVADILSNVRENGFAAVREYSLRFDKAEPREISREELDAAYASCSPELIGAMERSAANIRDYNEHLLTRTMEWRSPDGRRGGPGGPRPDPGGHLRARRHGGLPLLGADERGAPPRWRGWRRS